MNDTLLSCDAFDAMLPDYLEGTLDATRQAVVERHAHGCIRCGALLGDLLAITTQARSLPDLVPARNLWDGIAARIEAPVVTLPAGRGTGSLWRRRPAAWIGAAAAALVVATAGLTYV
ncbi:MAG: anti-sigma factor family protein, partial [Gemmatimonadaceae bacterium]